MAKIDMVPVKWKILRRDNGEADNIDEHLNSVLRMLGIAKGGSQFIDEDCAAFVRDKISNLGTGAEHGVGACLMPKAVAEAVATEYGTVAGHRMAAEIISEADFETFYEERGTAHIPQDRLDTDELNGIAARVQLEKDLGITPSADLVQRRKDALDPDNTQMGVRRNRVKKWADVKADSGVELYIEKQKAK